jgi:hypothetical protein
MAIRHGITTNLVSEFEFAIPGVLLAYGYSTVQYCTVHNPLFTVTVFIRSPREYTVQLMGLLPVVAHCRSAMKRYYSLKDSGE